MAENGANGYRPVSDRELVLAFQEGDEEAYSEVYRRYNDRVRRTCARVLRDPQDAEEATQEAFLRAYQALGRFNGRYQLGAWLGRIATNVSIDLVRSRNRGATLVPLPAGHELVELDEGPEETVVGSNPKVSYTMEGLQPLHARALELRALQGMSHEEMAGRLEMTPGQVKALLHRARRSFRRVWDKAEGWAVAPLAGIRSLFGPRSNDSQLGGSGTNLAVMGAANMPMMAERIATSALIVAVAVSGIGATSGVGETTTPTPPGAEVPDVERIGGDERRSHAIVAAAPSGQRPAATTEAAAERPQPARELVGKVRNVVASQSGKLTTSDEDKSDDDEGRKRQGAAGPGEAEIKKAGKKVKDILDSAPPPDLLP